MHTSISRALVAAVLLALAACGSSKPGSEQTSSNTKASASRPTTAEERASMGCGLLIGRPEIASASTHRPEEFVDPLAVSLFRSAAAGSSEERYARLLATALPLVKKPVPSRTRQATLSACRQAGYTQAMTDFEPSRILACRMARELAVERPHLADYVVPLGRSVDSREPYGGHMTVLLFALMGGQVYFLDNHRLPTMPINPLETRDEAYVDQLAGAIEAC